MRTTAEHVAYQVVTGQVKLLMLTERAKRTWLDPMTRQLFRMIERFRAQELMELDRMTDDGCPLWSGGTGDE